MKKLYMHIGFGKTGSSALQSWLSLNAKNLAQQGINYADLVPAAKAGQITSGNGFEMFKAAGSKDYARVEKLITRIYFGRKDTPVAIVSCEQLHHIGRPQLNKIFDICVAHGIDITVVAYVRSVYERAFSAYVQGVKRKGTTEAFRMQDATQNFSTTVFNLKKYVAVFGDDIVVLNYDDQERNIFSAFAKVTGIDISGLDALNSRVNRSLSTDEIDVMCRLNELHGGKFSALISRYLVTNTPDRPSSVRYLEPVVRQVCAEMQDGLAWINQTFAPQPPMAPALSARMDVSGSTPEGLAQVYREVASWVVSYQPKSDQAAEFREFADSLLPLLKEASIDTQIVQAVTRKAQASSPGMVKSLLGRLTRS